MVSSACGSDNFQTESWILTVVSFFGIAYYHLLNYVKCGLKNVQFLDLKLIRQKS